MYSNIEVSEERIFMEHSAFKINQYIRENKFGDLIQFAERLHDGQYDMLLRLIIEANNSTEDGNFVGAVLVTGPSSSGKTTFSHQLCQKLEDKGFSCTVISVDDYYLNRDEICRRQIERGEKPKEGEAFDFECIEAFDVPLFRKQMTSFVNGEEVELPVYDFTIGRPEYNSGRKIQTDGHDILIVEGIQAMNPLMWDGIGFSRTFKVYICPFNVYSADGGEDVITSNQIRFMRRAIRDHAKRDSTLAYTMHMWPAVRKGEENYIKPMKKFADFFFNSSLCYEISFLKKRIYEMREELNDEDKEQLEKFLSFEALEHFIPHGGFIVPKNSIFNEFYYE